MDFGLTIFAQSLLSYKYISNCCCGCCDENRKILSNAHGASDQPKSKRRTHIRKIKAKYCNMLVDKHVSTIRFFQKVTLCVCVCWKQQLLDDVEGKLAAKEATEIRMSAKKEKRVKIKNETHIKSYPNS